MAEQIPIHWDVAAGTPVVLGSGDILAAEALGTGTADAAVVLHGDGVWRAADGVPAGGTTGQVLTKQSATDGDADWEDPAAGSGDLVGPSSSTANTVLRFSGSTGKLAQGSGVTIDDSNNIGGVVDITLSGNVDVSGTVDGRDVAADGSSLDAHTAASSPHSGHATLVGGLVPMSQLATGTPDGSKFLRDDGVLATPAGSGDVSGPGTSTANRVAIFDDTSGTSIAQTVVSIDGSGNITGIGTVDGRDVAADGTKLDGIASGAEVNTASNLAATASHGGVGVYASKSASDLRLRPIVQSRQVIVSNVGNDVRVAFDQSRYRPARDAADRFKGYRSSGLWVAGSASAAPSVHGPNFLGTGSLMSVASGVYTRTSGSFVEEGFSVGNVCTVSGFVNGANNGSKTLSAVSHLTMAASGGGLTDETAVAVSFSSYTEHLYPFMVATCLDYEGYPHDRHQRLESNLASGNVSETLGYAAGDFVAKGEFSRGAKIIYDGCGYAANTINADAFFEFVLEPNPTVAGAPVYAGSNRMRMMSGELGQTWTGSRPFHYRIELFCEGANAYSCFGEFTIVGGNGLASIKRECGGRVTSGFNWQTTDAVLQNRWRVDRIANLDTYDDTYQGLSTLALAVTNYGVRGEGF